MSGTKIREMLQSGDFDGFSAAMPKGANAQNIWNILTGNVSENRRYSLVEALFSNTF